MQRLAMTCALLLLGTATACPICGEENSKIVWKQTGVLPAPEAVQAAAADEKHVYAITNTLVAKYDRRSGERLATSTGEAKHLNSGFMWEGKLYCAHSNYPQTPERSEIKVLDVESMRLTTFKDFGNFGGSLTWSVRHEDHWWCNFARYGDDNSQTFLVKFDNDWREQGRWTYPPEVVRELGRMSLSGGLWRDRSLLATDHDNLVLYQLRLPKAGRVLEFVGQHSAPFTGQGIAHDPHTGGLIGINRAMRQVIFANRNVPALMP
ncbi:MAG: endonuclease [Planctomycetales bacterium]|nr:endonuclease [Planctomycetales bacterium]